MAASVQKAKRTARIQDSEESLDDEKGADALGDGGSFLGGVSPRELWKVLLKGASSLGSDVRFDTSNIDESVSTMADFGTTMDSSLICLRSSSRIPHSPGSPLSFSKGNRRGNFGEVSGFCISRSVSPANLPCYPGFSRFTSMAKRSDIMRKKGAAPRGCRVNREGVPLLAPMSYDESVVAIQSHYRVHVASKRYRKLVNEIRIKIRGKDGENERKIIVLTDEDREAGRVAMERLAGSSSYDIRSLLRSSLEVYFDYSPLLCPGVASVETLFDALTALPSALDHFLALVDTTSILALLDTRLPLRTQHIALLCFSALLRGGVALVPPLPSSGEAEDKLLMPSFITGNSSSSSPGALMDVGHRSERIDPSFVNNLIARLLPLIEMEYDEHVVRYGSSSPTLRPEPGPRKGYARVLKMMQPEMRDARWKEQSSTISVHAAVCVWGISSRVLRREARQEAALRL